MVDEAGCDCLDDLERLAVLWGDPTPRPSGGYEYCTVERCRACGRLWKWRYQCHPGTGCDHFRVPVGGKERNLEFTYREAAEILERIDSER